VRVLAVTHEASRTGAVLAFMEALPVLRDLSTELVIVNKSPGPLSSQLRAFSDVFIEAPRPLTSQGRRIARFRSLDRFVPRIEQFIARSIVKEICPDFVYASTVLSSEYATAAQQLGVSACLHVHEAQPLSGWALRRSGVDLGALPMVAPSRFIAGELNELGGASVPTLLGPTRSMGSPDDDAVADLPWNQDSFRVIGCGSVARWKGPERWLAAAEALSSVDGRIVQWVWVGSGDQLPALRAETHRRGLDDRVHWIGERENVQPYLASADLFVLTSDNEPLGLVLLEAAAVGVASVAFRTGGVPEILVDDRALVQRGNVDELVEKVRAVLLNPELGSELLDASRPALVESDPTNWRRHLGTILDVLVQ